VEGGGDKGLGRCAEDSRRAPHSAPTPRPFLWLSAFGDQAGVAAGSWPSSLTQSSLQACPDYEQVICSGIKA
jgi:hypothetical protein